MKPYISGQIVVELTCIAVLCAIAFLSLGVSPGFTAALSRGTDLSVTLAAMRSMIYPVCAIMYRWPRFGACAQRPMDRIHSLFCLPEKAT